MNKICSLFLLGLVHASVWCQDVPKYFAEIQTQFPHIPENLCAAVSYQQTRWKPNPNPGQPSCNGRPAVVGILGWVVEPNPVFRNHLQRVADLSGMSEDEILSTPQQEIHAWHLAMDSISKIQTPHSALDWLTLAFSLSEIPDFNNTTVDWAAFYWFEELRNSWVKLGGPAISLDEMKPTQALQAAERSGLDGVAVWQPSPACNFSSRNGNAVTAATVHTTQGSFAGALAWFMSCQSNVSTHYLIRSSDGFLLQLVNEDAKAWHVGTENAYTIGIEHEGFVSNPAWYTDTMYASSASLIQRIAQRHGIELSRSAWWPWSAATTYAQHQRPGVCTRIKGHQHFPNQTHTDPGPNWDWARFSNLIQGHQPLETTMGLSGTIAFPHLPPYAHDSLKQWRIQVPRGKVNLQFQSMDLELNWDYLTVYDGPSTADSVLLTATGNQIPASFLSTGREVLIRFRSDCAISGQGFVLNWNMVEGAGEDSIPPSTQILPIGQGWISQDFQQGFADVDSGGSGLLSTFWTAVHHDGQGYYGRNQLGMMADFFEAPGPNLHSQWSIVSGQWQQGNGQIFPTQPAGISAVSAQVPQGPSGERYWAFDFIVFPNGNQPRVSLYVAADQPAGLGRNHSIEWRLGLGGLLEIYRWEQNQAQLLANIPMPINPGQLNRCLIGRRDSTYRFFLNHTYLGELQVAGWPQNQAQYISLESKEAITAFDGVHSGIGRFPNLSQHVGTGVLPIGHFPNANPNPNTPAGRILSLAMDGAGNLSTWQTADYNLDFSPPYASAWIHDGMGVDVDTFMGPLWMSNWGTSADPNSGLSSYEMCIGSSPGACDIQPWQTNGLGVSWQGNASSLSIGNTYFSGVRALNGAGMIGAPTFSDGAIWLHSTGIEGSFQPAQGWAGPNPFSESIEIKLNKPGMVRRVRLMDIRGRIIKEDIIPNTGTLKILGLHHLAEGMYVLSMEGIPSIRLIKLGF